MRHQFLASLFLMAFCIATLPAHAQDAPASEKLLEEAAPQEKADVKAAEKHQDKAEDLKEDLVSKMDKLQKRLDEKQSRHFGIIYNNHNLIETVKTVRNDVGKAVNACSENNKGMAGKMQKRFEDWETAVNAKLTEAEGLTQSMIFAQDYASKDEIEGALKAADAMRAHSQTIYEKVPVTSKEACEFLYEKMVETKDNMVSLLGTTLISVPQEMQKADDAPPAAPAKSEEAPAEDIPADESAAPAAPETDEGPTP